MKEIKEHLLHGFFISLLSTVMCLLAFNLSLYLVPIFLDEQGMEVFGLILKEFSYGYFILVWIFLFFLVTYNSYKNKEKQHE